MLHTTSAFWVYNYLIKYNMFHHLPLHGIIYSIYLLLNPLCSNPKTLYKTQANSSRFHEPFPSHPKISHPHLQMTLTRHHLRHTREGFKAFHQNTEIPTSQGDFSEAISCKADAIRWNHNFWGAKPNQFHQFHLWMFWLQSSVSRDD